MMIKSIAIAFVYVALVVTSAWSQEVYKEREADSDVAQIADSNEAMNKAMSRANETLEIFGEALNSGEHPREYFQLKIQTEVAPGDYEHMWFIFVDSTDEGEVRGLLIHNPYNPASDYREGEIYPLDLANLSDWRYLDNGKWRGDFTTRVIISQMEAAGGADALSEYHDDPLPPSALFNKT